jgi:hypothetical protein
MGFLACLGVYCGAGCERVLAFLTRDVLAVLLRRSSTWQHGAWCRNYPRVMVVAFGKSSTKPNFHHLFSKNLTF